jgi:hypothetical protein
MISVPLLSSTLTRLIPALDKNVNAILDIFSQL